MKSWLLLPGSFALGMGLTVIWPAQRVVLFLVWLLVALLAVLQPKRYLRKLLLLASLSGFLGTAWFQWRMPTPTFDDVVQLAPAQQLALTGRVVSDLEVLGSDRWRFEVDALMAGRTLKVSGKTLVYLKQTQPMTYRIGDTIQLQGRLSRVPAGMNFGAFSYQDYLARQQIFSLFYAENSQLQSRGMVWEPMRLLQALRQDLVQGLETHLPLGSARVLASLIVGEKAAPVPPEIKAVFQAVGLQHVLAVSGFQVQLVVLSLLGLCLSLRLPRRLCFGLAIVGLWGFVALTGAPPSVLRAACVASLGLVGFVCFRQADPLWALTIGGTALLIWNPQLLLDIGFQFSMLATAGLLLSSGMILRRLDFLPLPLAGLCAPVLAAQVWVMPAQLFHFGSLSWLFLPANLLAGLLTTVLTWLALAGMLSGYLLPWLQGWVLLPADWLTHILLQLLEMLLTLPAPLWQFRPLPLGATLLAYVLLACSLQGQLNLYPVQQKHIRAFLIALLLALPLVIAGRSWAETLSCPVRVTYLSVGQGDSVLIEAAGQTILIDAGPRWPSDNSPTGFQDAGERYILPYLQQRGIRQLDLALLSHPHLDHYGGYFSLAQALPIKRFMTVSGAGESSEKGAYQDLLNSLVQRNIPVDTVQHGALHQLASELRLIFWQPLAVPQSQADSETEVEHASTNNRSVVVQLIHQQVRFLFSGDLEAEGEQQLLQTPGFQAHSQILKVPHHGSQTSSTAAFLAEVQAREAIVSVGERNRFQHPSADVLARYQAGGSRVWRTDTDGAICVCSQGSGYRVQTVRSAKR